MTTPFKIPREEQPDSLAVAFDVGRTFRDDKYTAYKARRAHMPDNLRYQIERIDALIRALNLRVLTLDNYEAGDVLGLIGDEQEISAAEQWMAETDG